MKTVWGTHGWSTVAISLVLIVALVGLGYGAFRMLTGPSAGPATQVSDTGTLSFLTPELGLDLGIDLGLEPQVSLETEEAILVPEVAVSPEAGPAFQLPTYTLEMAQQAVQTRILRAPLTAADIFLLVLLLGPGPQLVPVPEEIVAFPIEEVAPVSPLEIDPFMLQYETSVVPAEEAAPEPMPEEITLPTDIQEYEETEF